VTQTRRGKQMNEILTEASGYIYVTFVHILHERIQSRSHSDSDIWAVTYSTETHLRLPVFGRAEKNISQIINNSAKLNNRTHL